MPKEHAAIKKYQEYREERRKFYQGANLTLFMLGLAAGDKFAHVPFDANFLFTLPSEAGLVMGVSALVTGLYAFHHYDASSEKYTEFNHLAQTAINKRTTTPADKIAEKGARLKNLSFITESLEYASAGFLIGLTLSDAQTGKLHADMVPIISSFIATIGSDIATSLTTRIGKNKLTEAETLFLQNKQEVQAKLVSIRRDS